MTYTCADYRLEQRLLSLQRQLQEKDLTPKLRREIEEEIKDLERCLKMD